jgi:CheY-like chemotaxis protein
MKTKMDEDHAFYKYVDTMESGAMRAAELTSQLLAFARGGKYETRPVNLNRIVDETLKLVDRTFDKSIEIATDLFSDLPTVEADAGQMQQALMNLCVNAGDAMPTGGLMVIRTAVERGAGVYAEKQPDVDARDYVVISVSDNGIGMDTETSERIFEPFFTTKEEGKGTGLGLSMVYGVIKNHGGFVNVYSEPGHGATFRVYLPASDQPEALKTPEAVAPHGKNELVLVVDDEEPIRELAREILESYGYRVMLATDGADGVEKYRAGSGEISLVLLDMVMPRLGGQEAFLRMKEINPDVRTLLSTGYSQDGRAREILESGAIGFVQKPYRVAALLSAVRNALDTAMRA